MSAAIFKREKKELTPTQQKVRTAINWIVNILCVVIIILALVISIMTITRTAGEKRVANLFGTAFMPVQSPSMSGTFEENDLILTKLYEGDGTDLKVGQVITFWTVRNNVEVLNTHRIVAISTSELTGKPIFTTRGDASSANDPGYVQVEKIVATWGTPGEPGDEAHFGKNWGQIGKAINWLQRDRTNYFLAILLPLILLFVIYAFILIRTFVIAKLDKAGKVTVDSLSDEEKQRLAEEYLASLNKEGLDISDKSGNADDGAPASEPEGSAGKED